MSTLHRGLALSTAVAAIGVSGADADDARAQAGVKAISGALELEWRFAAWMPDRQPKSRDSRKRRESTTVVPP